MHRLLKYLLIMIVLTILVLFYFRYTQSGQKNAYTLFSFYASHKLDMPVKIQDIDINQLPYIKANIILHKHYQVSLDGFIENKHMQLRYNLHSNCFTSKICTFDDTIKVSGTLAGWGDQLKVTGKGQALDGNVSYDFVKEKNQYKDIHLTLKEINASKLFTLLDEEVLFKGKANAVLNSDVIDDKKHAFNISLNTKELQLAIKKGIYNHKKKSTDAKYTLDIHDLSSLKTQFGTTLNGSVHTSGELNYNNENLTIKGMSTDFGGEFHFTYLDKELHLSLQDVSLQRLMQTFDTQAIIDANIVGEGVYSFTHKKMELKTKLHQVKLLPSPILQAIENRFSLSLKNEIFDTSNFTFKLKDNIISSNLTLSNTNMHFILTDTTLNASRDAIRTHIDIKVPKHSAKGILNVRNNDIKRKAFKDVYLTFDGSIEKHYKVTLDGLMSESFINMAYHINAKRLSSHIVTIVDDINLSGYVSGSPDRLHISGEGLAMEGKVFYKGLKQKKHWENVSLTFQDIHALKLFTLLGKPTFPNGKADINASFSYLDGIRTKGEIAYVLKNGRFKTLPLSLKTKAIIKDKEITFSSHAKLSTADINISKGVYRFDTNTSKVSYTVSTHNLAPLEPLIGKYLGAFSATGKLTYNKDLYIRGLSQTFGGMVDFLYKKNMLYIDLEKVSLKRVMNLFDYPHMLTAQINGNINYNYTKEQILVRTDLNNTRFLKSDLVHTIFKKSGINMLKEVFSQSTLFAIYQHNILAGDLILKNKQSHFIVKNTQINTKKDTVHANFDLRMQGQAFSGTVYGSLQDPKVKLDMKKLMRYQMDKQVDSVIGKGNRELMESMPMGGAAKDIATDMGAGIMEMFF